MATAALTDLHRRKQKYKESLRADFLRLFELDIDEYWNTTVGCIDLSSFVRKDVLECPNGVSVYQQIENLFGSEAIDWLQKAQKDAFEIQPDWSLDEFLFQE